MKQHKVRGKKKNDSSIWVYGYYFRMHHNDARRHAHHFIIPNCTEIPKEKTIGEIQVEVIEETISSYTGWWDSEADEIYEGSIIEFATFDYNGVDSHYIGVVKWHHEAAMYVVGVIGEKSYCGGELEFGLGDIEQEDIKVVGNIYDNPELLEEE